MQTLSTSNLFSFIAGDHPYYVVWGGVGGGEGEEDEGGGDGGAGEHPGRQARTASLRGAAVSQPSQYIVSPR